MTHCQHTVLTIKCQHTNILRSIHSLVYAHVVTCTIHQDIHTYIHTYILYICTCVHCHILIRMYVHTCTHHFRVLTHQSLRALSCKPTHYTCKLEKCELEQGTSNSQCPLQHTYHQTYVRTYVRTHSISSHYTYTLSGYNHTVQYAPGLSPRRSQAVCWGHRCG